MWPKTKSLRKYFEKLVALVMTQVFLVTSLIMPSPAYPLNQKESKLAPALPTGTRLGDKTGRRAQVNGGLLKTKASSIRSEEESAELSAFSDMVKAGKQWLKTLIPEEGFVMSDGTKVTRITDVSQLPEGVRKYWDNHVGIVVMENDRLHYTAYVGFHHMLPFKKTLKGLGGTRNLLYASTEDALIDALILPRAMSDKAAYLGAEGIPLGGGKLVINSNPNVSIDKRKEVYASVGAALEKLNIILTGQDVNTTLELALHMSQSAPNSLIGHSSMPLGGKETAPWTADGVFSGWQGMIRAVEGEEVTLQGRNISILGVGGVGSNLVRLVVENGILALDGKNVLYVTDSRKEALEQIRNAYGELVEAGRIVIFDNPDDIFNAPAEIFSPNATRYELNSRTIPKLMDAGVKYIAGAENEQLETPEDAERLHEAGIIYVVDYVINAGGMAAAVSTALDLDMTEVVKGIGESVYQLVKQAKEQNVSPVKIADVEAARRLKAFDVQLLENAKMLLAQVKPITPAARRATGTGTPARLLREDIKEFFRRFSEETNFTITDLAKLDNALRSTIRDELKVLVALGLVRKGSDARGGKAAQYQLDDRFRALTDEGYAQIAAIDGLNSASFNNPKVFDDERVAGLKAEINQTLSKLLGDPYLTFNYPSFLYGITGPAFSNTGGQMPPKVIVLQPHMIGEALGFVAYLENLIANTRGEFTIIIDGSQINDLEGFVQVTGLKMKGDGYMIITESVQETVLEQANKAPSNIIAVGTDGYLTQFWTASDILKLQVDVKASETSQSASLGIIPLAIAIALNRVESLPEELKKRITKEGNTYSLSPTAVSQAYSEGLAAYKKILGAK